MLCLSLSLISSFCKTEMNEECEEKSCRQVKLEMKDKRELLPTCIVNIKHTSDSVTFLKIN